MKNFNYLCLSLILVLFACTKEVGMEEVPKDTIVNDVEALTDADRALYSLTTMLDDVAPQTRMTSGQTIKAQTLINVSDIIAEEYSDVAGYDNAFYLVTLENENGVASTAFLGATPNLPSVIAIINGVEYTIENCCEACAEIFGYEYIAADDTITRSSLGTGTPGLIVPPIVPPISTIIGTPSVPWDPGTPSDPDPEVPLPDIPTDPGDSSITTHTNVEWRVTYQVDPLMKSHFHQHWPFNDDYDYMNGTSGNKYYAGCTIVALAQILAYNKIERNFGPNIIGKAIIDWNNIELAINRQELLYNQGILEIKETTPNTYTKAEVNALSVLCKAIADIIKPTYTSNGTYVYTNDAVNFLKDCGYNKVKKEDYNSDVIFDMVVTQQLPVNIDGADPNSGTGHSWVIDGWYERELLEITTIKENGVIVGAVSEVINTEKYAHYNWGWSTGQDGYYEVGVFDTLDVFRETSVAHDEPMVRDYCANINLVTYN